MKHLTKGVRRLWRKDGVKFDRVTYYPRTPDHIEPSIKPTKLLMIERVKPYSGQPYWHKKVIDDLKLQPGSLQKIAIVKNTPDMNCVLMSIKHLIKITPIDIPEKLPEDILTNKETYLHPNGKMMIFPKADQERIDATTKFQNDEKKFDIQSIRKQWRLKWLNPMASQPSVKKKDNL